MTHKELCKKAHCTNRAEYLVKHEGYLLEDGYKKAEKEWEENNKIVDFVDSVLDYASIEAYDIDILYSDLDRIELAIDSEWNNYTIRMWNIDDDGIRFTLYKYRPDIEGVEEITSGYYKFR